MQRGSQAPRGGPRRAREPRREFELAISRCIEVTTFET